MMCLEPIIINNASAIQLFVIYRNLKLQIVAGRDKRMTCAQVRRRKVVFKETRKVKKKKTCSPLRTVTSFRLMKTTYFKEQKPYWAIQLITDKQNKNDEVAKAVELQRATKFIADGFSYEIVRYPAEG